MIHITVRIANQKKIISSKSKNRTPNEQPFKIKIENFFSLDMVYRTTCIKIGNGTIVVTLVDQIDEIK